MAKVFIEESTLTKIGNSIRNKTGKTELIDPAVMDVEIDSIVSGGGDLPEEAFNITGSCSQRFAYNAWNWFVEGYGDRVTTKDISSLQMFANQSYNLTKIPFQINIKDAYMINGVFNECKKLATCPKIRGTFQKSTSLDMQNILDACYRLRDVEDLFDSAELDGLDTIKCTGAYTSPKFVSFKYCASLRQIPTWFSKLRISKESTAYPTYMWAGYYDCFNGCYALDEIKNLKVIRCNAAATDNLFSSTFNRCSRIKSLTFETQEDGTPYGVKWKSQVIDLSFDVGWINTPSDITDYNSGLTADTQVKSLDSYNMLKDNPDWWTALKEYSRYNHDSAVETINSLPDTSAYLATAGGTNTIKFRGVAGSSTDGGAINTLTEEEIAVATAKGWTVSLV